MRQIFRGLTLSLVAAAALTGCKEDVAEPVRFSFENLSPSAISYDYNWMRWPAVIVTVAPEGGDLTIICDNYDRLRLVYDVNGNGNEWSQEEIREWGEFRIEGNRIFCHFPELPEDYRMPDENTVTLAPRPDATAIIEVHRQ